MSIASYNGRVGTSTVIYDKFDGAAAAIEGRSPDTVNQSLTTWGTGSSSAGMSIDGNGVLYESTTRTYHDIEVNAKAPNRTVKTRISSTATGNCNMGVHVRGTANGASYDYIYVAIAAADTCSITMLTWAGGSITAGSPFTHSAVTPATLVVEDDGTLYTAYLEDDDGNVISGSTTTGTAAATATDTYYGIFLGGTNADLVSYYDFKVI